MGFLSKVFDFITDGATLALTAVGAALVLFVPGAAAIGWALLTSVALSAVAAGLLPEVEDISFDLTTPVRQTIAQAIAIYGETATAGSFVYQVREEDTTSALFDNDEATYIHQIMVLAPHEVESIEIYAIDGYPYIDPPEATDEEKEMNQLRRDNIRFQYRLGTANQSALSHLPDEWTSAHRGRGLAYVHVIIKENFEVYPATPVCLFRVKGKKVKIPGGTTVWTDNAVAVIRDVIQSLPQINAPDSAFNEAEFTKQYNNAEQNWIYHRPNGEEYNDKKWSINGGINMSMNPQQIIRSLRDHIGGSIEEYAGEWNIRTGDWEEPTLDITDANLLSHLAYNPIQPIRSRFNVVKGIYAGEETDWKRTDFEPIEYQQEIEAEGKKISVDLKMGLAKHQELAQRAGHIALRRIHWVRQSVVGFFDYEKTRGLRPGDVVRYRDEVLGPNAVPYQVVAKQLKTIEGGVGTQLILRRTDAAIYLTNFDVTYPPYILRHLPGAGGGLPAIEVTDNYPDDLEGETGVVQVQLCINVTSHFFSTAPIELQYQEYTTEENEDYISIGTSSFGKYLVNVNAKKGDLYRIRARVLTIFGNYSRWNTVLHAIGAELPGLPVPFNLSYNIVGGAILLQWEVDPSPFLSFTQVRMTSECTDNPNWEDGRILIEKVGRPSTSAVVPIASGTYMVRCFDRLHNTTEEFAHIQIKNIQDSINYGSERRDSWVPYPDADRFASIHNLVYDTIGHVYIQNPRPNEKGSMEGSWTLTPGIPYRLNVDIEIDKQSVGDINDASRLYYSTDSGNTYSPFLVGSTILGDNLTLRVELTKGAGRSPVITKLDTDLQRSI